MADSKITALTALTAADPANDMIPIVDVSDTPPASGNTKRISINNLLACSPSATLASATITGNLTVDTSTLVVNPAGYPDRVGIGTATPARPLDIVGSFQSSLGWVLTGTPAGLGAATRYIGGASTTDSWYYNGLTGGSHIWAFGESTAMTLNSTGLGVGGVPSGANRFLIFNGATQALTLDASGNLLLGKTVNSIITVGFQSTATGEVSAALAASTNAATQWTTYSTGAAAYRFYVGMGGTVFATNTTISAISDSRLKENVQDLDVGLNEVLALKPRKFDWKAGKGKDIKGDRGFIAQEFETVFPNLIDEWKDEAPEGEAPYKSVRQDLIPVLVKAIQELAAEVNALKKA